MIKQTSMSKIPWEFSPYNREVRDMGKWFKQVPINDYFNYLKFYNRIIIMLEGKELNHEEMRDELKDNYGLMLSLCKNII